MSKGRLLVVDDEVNVRRSMEMIHEGAGYEVHCVETGEAALDFLAACSDAARPDLVYLDIQMPGIDGLETLRRIQDAWPGQPVVMISGHANVEGAVGAMKAGALDFLEKGFSKARLLATTGAAMERGSLRREVASLRARLEAGEAEEILGDSEAMQALREQIARVAPSPAQSLPCVGSVQPPCMAMFFVMMAPPEVRGRSIGSTVLPSGTSWSASTNAPQP